LKKKEEEYKPNYPVIIICARDWNIYQGVYDTEEKFTVAKGWIAGWLLKENEDCLIVTTEDFEDTSKNQVRYVMAIPKETILFKKIIKNI